MCHRRTVSSLIEVLPRACDNLPLETSLQECSYFQQVLFAESLPGAFFQGKVRKMRFLCLTLGFILKPPLVLIHGYTHRCLRLLCKRPCAGNLLIIKFSLGALLVGPRVGSAGWAMSADRQRPAPCLSCTRDSTGRFPVSSGLCDNGSWLNSCSSGDLEYKHYVHRERIVPFHVNLETKASLVKCVGI